MSLAASSQWVPDDGMRSEEKKGAETPCLIPGEMGQDRPLPPGDPEMDNQKKPWPGSEPSMQQHQIDRSWVRTRGTRVLAGEIRRQGVGPFGATRHKALRGTVGASRLKVSFWICFCDSVWRRPLFSGGVWICFMDERLPAGRTWCVILAGSLQLHWMSCLALVCLAVEQTGNGGFQLTD